MTQYIDKSALVAEIEKCYNECLKRAKIIDSSYWNSKADAYRNVLEILDDTLEVKDLQEEPVIVDAPPYDYVKGFSDGRLYEKRQKEEPVSENLKLSWEDIPKIFQISEELKTSWWFRDNEQTKLIGTQTFWEEVLKRFNKQRKEN